MSFWRIETDAQFVVVNGSTLKMEFSVVFDVTQRFSWRNACSQSHSFAIVLTISLNNQSFKFGIKQVDHNGQISTMKG